MFHLTLILLILFCSSSNALTKTTKATVTTTKATTTTIAPSEKLFCASCSYEYTFDELRNRSTWLSPWSRCQNQTASASTFGATACHTLIRVDYAHQYVIFYYNASYRSVKKLHDDDQRIVIETTMGTNGSRAQLKAFYECSFENNCHLPLNPFLQLRTALALVKYNHTNFIQQLNQFYNKPKADIHTYFHADTLTLTMNAYCGDMNQFDKESLKTVKPKCVDKKDKLKSTSMGYEEDLKFTVYTCDGPRNTYCNSEKKLKKFLKGIMSTAYMQTFLQH